MSDSSQSQPRSLLGKLWGAVDTSRRFVMNIVFLFIVIALVAVLLMPGRPGLKDKTALVLALDGRIVEQRSGDSLSSALNQLDDELPQQTQLRDIVAVLDAAAKDPKIDRVVLQLDGFGGAGLATLREVAQAIGRFKASGKQVVAWGGYYTQPGYYLAAHADEVYLHPMGMVMLEGYGRHRNYYKAALDRIGVSANVIRSGKYKNFGEPYFTTAPSKETLESDKYLYDDLWATYTTDVEKARKFAPGTINKGIDEGIARLKASGGDFAKLALEAKLITALKTRDELHALLVERGAADDDKKTFRQVSLVNYLAIVKPSRGSGDAVGVVVAEGDIVDGNAPPGRVGGRSTAELIRRARADDAIKAIVLRVNSPGGSAYGSELIRRELELTRAAGKPVVVSMGSVAASGGYWIAMAADEVIADAATITGSIGVFGMLPTGEKAMEKLSIHTGGYHTTWLGEAMYDPRRALDPRMAELVRLAIDRIYTDFTTRAAAARKTTPDKIDAVAQGRVWTGSQAKDRGLIDRTGSFNDAVKSAASRAKLDDKARVAYIEADKGRLAQFIDRFASQINGALVKTFNLKLMSSLMPAAVAEDVLKDWAWLAEMGERGKNGLPFAAVTHCLCVAE